MEHVAKGRTELMVASHNQHSVESALAAMHRNGFRTHSPGRHLCSCLYFSTMIEVNKVWAEDNEGLTWPVPRIRQSRRKSCLPSMYLIPIP